MKLVKGKTEKSDLPNLDVKEKNTDYIRKMLNEVMARVLAESGMGDNHKKRKLTLAYSHLEIAAMYIDFTESGEVLFDLTQVRGADKDKTIELRDRLKNL